MGQRGPVPKRESERRRRNKTEPTDKVEPIVATFEPPKAKSTWHPMAKGWYESLSESGQSRFYEPSDWWHAQYLAEAMSLNLRQKTRFSSVLFAAVMSGMNDLLTTESARRRVRMEIERADDSPAEPAGVTALADYRSRLNG